MFVFPFVSRALYWITARLAGLTGKKKKKKGVMCMIIRPIRTSKTIACGTRGGSQTRDLGEQTQCSNQLTHRLNSCVMFSLNENQIKNNVQCFITSAKWKGWDKWWRVTHVGFRKPDPSVISQSKFIRHPTWLHPSSDLILVAAKLYYYI